MKPKFRIVLTIFATLAGIFSLLLYTTLVQDVFFKDTFFNLANNQELTLMIMGLLTAGLITGFLASLLVMQDNSWPHIAISLLVFAKALFIVQCNFLNPFWFQVLLNGSLVAGLWIGYYMAVKFPLSPA